MKALNYIASNLFREADGSPLVEVILGYYEGREGEKKDKGEFRAYLTLEQLEQTLTTLTKFKNTLEAMILETPLEWEA